MAFQSVQFRGSEAVLQAYDNRRVDCWGIWEGKSLMTKDQGSAALEAFLQMLERGGSKTVYTLKIFEDCDSPKNIKENSPADGSFKFTLVEFDEHENPKYYGTNNAQARRIDALEKKLADAEKDDEPDSIGSIGIELLRNPHEALQLVNVFNAIIGRPLVAIPEVAAGALGAVSAEENKEARAAAAIDVLEQKDPKLVTHLEKLAQLAKEKPDSFKFLLSTLDTMK